MPAMIARTGPDRRNAGRPKVDAACHVSSRTCSSIHQSESSLKVALVGAPSSIGIRPDDATGEPQHVDLAPATLRSIGVIDAIGAVDLGDVHPPDYRDFDPAGTARRVVEAWAQRFDRLLVHVDVDVLDYLDLPIAEETRRNRGLRFDQLVAALRVLVAAPNWVALTVCEINPDHGEGDGSTLETLCDGLADVLSSVDARAATS